MTIVLSNVNFNSSATSQMFINATSNSFVIKANNSVFAMNSSGIYVGNAVVNSSGVYRDGSPVTSAQQFATGEIIIVSDLESQPSGTINTNFVYSKSEYSSFINQPTATSVDNFGFDLTLNSSGGGLRDIAFGNGIYVAVGEPVSSTPNVKRSTDGINWTTPTIPFSGNITLHSVEYANGLFMAIASNSSVTRCMTSTDGNSWTAKTNLVATGTTTLGGLFLAYGQGKFVCAYTTTGGSDDIRYTTDQGTTWTATSPTGYTNISDLKYFNDQFFVCAFSQGVQVSSNGSHYSNVSTLPNPPSTDPTNAIDYFNGKYILSSLYSLKSSSDLVTFKQIDALSTYNKAPGLSIVSNDSFCIRNFSSFKLVDLLPAGGNKSIPIATNNRFNRIKYLNNTYFGVGVLGSSNGIIAQANITPYNINTEFRLPAPNTLSGYTAYVKV